MAKILVCYKWVRDEADVKVNDDLSVDLSRAKYKISDYDKNTIETGSQLAKSMGAESVGVSCGGAETKKSFTDALARGLDSGVWINTDESEADAVETARLLAEAVRKCDDVKVVLCSEGSSDEYARQTGPRLGAKLDWPVVTGVIGVSLDGDSLLVDRKLEKVTQVLRVSMPCVLAVLPEIAPAPIPGLRAVMAARKKPVVEFKPEELGIKMDSPVTRNGMRGYISERKNIILTGDTSEETIKSLVAAMKKEAVI